MIAGKSTILVVDDEQFFRKLYQDLLSEEGYLIEVCSNGIEAVVRMRQGRVDLVLTDMVMPGTNGLEVLREARLLPNPPEVILVSGHASLESAIQALKEGARDYLVKPFNPEELKHLVRTCLEQRRLLEENNHLKTQIQLFQTGQALSSLIDLQRLIPQALDALLRQAGAESGCGFVLKDGVPRLLMQENLSDEQAEKLLDLVLPSFAPYAGFSSAGKASFDPVAGLSLNSEHLWLLPFSMDQELKGGLLLCEASVSLDKGEVPADLRYLCDQISLGFENSCCYQNAQDLMYTDDLTGLYNHRYLQVAMEQEIRRSQRYGLQFSLLFLDLDRFKEINDQYGHLAGSSALQEVGELLRHCVRDVDTLFRFGGDEFSAILVETDGRTARIVAERIRRTIDEYVFLDAQGTPSRLTVTAGFATFPTDAADKNVLLDLADRAMYSGKGTRNVIRGVEDIPQN
ncbi:MAG: diguanylate cyclase [Chloroflexi bacterium]|nr:diguanylate cyclase [Chloroflexota bacterium]